MPKSVRISKDGEIKSVSPKLADMMLQQGWELAASDVSGAEGKTVVETPTGTRVVDPAEADELHRRGKAQHVDTGAGSKYRKRAGDRLVEARSGDMLGKVQALGEAGLAHALPYVGDKVLESLESSISGDPSLVAERATTNPDWNFAGKLLSGVAVGLGGVAEAGAVRALSGPLGLASRGAAKLGAKVAGRAGKIAGTVTEGVADGIVFGGAGLVSDTLLHDKELSTDAIMAEAGVTALFGGALGGTIGLAGKGLSKLAGHIDDGALRAANPFLDEGSDAFKQLRITVDGSLDSARNARNAVSRELAPDAPLQTFVRRTGEPLDTTVRKAVSDAVKTQGRIEKAILDTNGNYSLKQVKKLKFEELDNLTDDIVHLDKIDSALHEAANVPYTPTKLSEAVAEVGQREGATLPAAGSPDVLALLEASDVSPFDASKIVEKISGSEMAGNLVNMWAMSRALGVTGARTGATQVGAIEKGARNFARWKTRKGAEGLIGNQPAFHLGNLVGNMGAAVGKAKTTVGAGVSKFVKLGARVANSKGTVPAATTILSKIRFDPNVGEKPKKGDVFKQRKAELDRAMANPEATAERVRKKLAPINHVNPEIGASMHASAMNKLGFYYSKLPRNPVEKLGLFRVGRWEPPTSEVARFARYVRAGENPFSLLDDMAAGRVSSESVEAVRTLYPHIYGYMQLALIEQLAEPGAVEKLAYGSRVQLAIFFERPTDPTLTADFYATQQDLHLRRAELAQQGGQDYSTPGAVSKAPGLTEPPTASQRIEGNG